MSNHPETLSFPESFPPAHAYLLPGASVPTLTALDVARHCPAQYVAEARPLTAIQPASITLDRGTFTSAAWSISQGESPTVTVEQSAAGLELSCTCGAPRASLCEFQAQVLLDLLRRPELRVFFDLKARRELLLATARDYGLEHAPDLDAHFQLTYARPAVLVTPRDAGLCPVTAASKQELISQLLSVRAGAPPAPGQRIIIFSRHKYYGHLIIQLAEAALTATGKAKSPVTVLNPLDVLSATDDATELKFYSGLARFQHNYDDSRSPAALAALQAILRNPAGLPFFRHNATVSDKLTGPSLSPLELRSAPADLRLSVHQRGEFYEVTGRLLFHDQPVDLAALTVRYDYFVALRGALYLVPDPEVWRIIDFFRKRNNTLLIHRSKYNEFQRDVLAGLEDRVPVSYSFVRPATPAERAGSGFDAPPEKRLYLTDAGQHVEVLPVMRYGTREVSILSRRQLLGQDELGRTFVLDRDVDAEARFLAALLRRYPAFREQLRQETLYVPKSEFLDEDWFLTAFEDWQEQQIVILGFNKLKSNTLNPHRVRVTVRVTGETNWFETQLRVQFGRQQASLRQLHQAVRNQSRYVRLDDGTRGILPREWLDRFARYFAAGEVVEETIRTPSINFSAIEELYDPEALAADAHRQLATYRAAVAGFGGIGPVAVPENLQTTLRDYQREGLNWLNFLDTLGFGGCLADDMGLGKTVQVLAFLLLQQARNPAATNLVVVPTSLLFNWQAEVKKFAPSLRIQLLHGPGRRPDTAQFDAADIVLTTYNTVVSDIRELRQYAFNYVVLDESQAIKNPASQRYKAACLLRARNRLVLTGTPVENNTFDLYGQLSFACPGLLGSRQHFQNLYASPIDKFKDEKHARALQRKISPFVLRRTKGQVARELPDKTEMVLYCEMGEEQRRLYEACKKDYRDRLMGIHEDSPRKESLHILQGLTKLRQICNSPALLPDQEHYGQQSAKLDALVEEIRSRAPQHKILIFSQFVAMLDLIRAELQRHEIPFAYVTGQTKNREAAVASFQEDEDVRVFLISLKAGGTGLNLTRADYVYLVDPWWNPAVENQAIDRAHRIGQTQKVVAVRLICPGTIEEKIMELQEAKRELAQDLIRTDATLVKSLTRQELLALFS
ncbi:SNF2 family helicase [Hymenobacter sp. BT175]|uniref:DEAD/DEAH box helicase n=1 Tax=Hymenobacter translucens TaxID=2886507 RepID=UPI001D0E9C8E|nr:DEAD/DEAH box helicase [Hymenobacter translucens]MCC2548224.1 SNF2 family helicase [Hymenobacter translucens]